MVVLSNLNYRQVCGGTECTGGGNAKGGSVDCTATVYKDKKNQVDVTVGHTAPDKDTRVYVGYKRSF